MEEAIDLLIKTDRIPEAAMLARTYAPDQISRIVKLWKSGLESKNRKKTAESLADPAEYPNLFPELAALSKKESVPLVDLESKEEEVAAKEEEEALVDATEEQEVADEAEKAEEAAEENESPSLI